MSDSMLADAVDQFFAGCCTPDCVRAVEGGAAGAARNLWQEVQSSGFADVLVPEAAGGAGLQLPDAYTVIKAAGRHLLPLPLAQTVILRAALAAAGIASPEGAMTIAPAIESGVGDALSARAVPFGLTAEWALVTLADGDVLLPLLPAERVRYGGQGSLDADLFWHALPRDVLRLPRDAGVDWGAMGAAVTAALIAGAMMRVAEMMIAHANERIQFGRPIGRQQAIQQQISAAVEQVVAADTAAQIALSGPGWQAGMLVAAMSKQRASDAVVMVANTAHAVHGAIGVTEEFDLQLLTRRLHEWRMHYGSESYWARRLGMAIVGQGLRLQEFMLNSLVAQEAGLPDSAR